MWWLGLTGPHPYTHPVPFAGGKNREVLGGKCSGLAHQSCGERTQEPGAGTLGAPLLVIFILAWCARVKTLYYHPGILPEVSRGPCTRCSEEGVRPREKGLTQGHSELRERQVGRAKHLLASARQSAPLRNRTMAKPPVAREDKGIEITAPNTTGESSGPHSHPRLPLSPY